MSNKVQEPLYDLSLLTEMGDDNFSIEILNIYLTETPLELEKLHTAAVHKNYKAVEAIAHKLKSGTQFLKIALLSNLLETIESKGDVLNDNGHLLEKVDEAVAIYSNLVKPLSNEIQLLINNRVTNSQNKILC